MNDILFYFKNEDVILIYKRMYSVWNKYIRKKESCVRKKEVGKRCGNLSGICGGKYVLAIKTLLSPGKNVACYATNVLNVVV